MLFPVALATLALAVPQYNQAPVGQYQPPRRDALRSPCPGLNTLANHGFLPRNGRGFTKEMVTNVFKEVYNIGEDISTFLLTEAFKIGLNDTATTLSLGSIGAHSVPQTKIEHDGSMVHVDFALAGNTITKDQKLVDMMVSYNKNGRSLTYDDLVAFRKDRWTQAIAANPKIDAGARPQFLASAETSLVFLNFKNAQNEVPIQTIRSFMGRDQLPRNFVKQATPITLAMLQSTAADIRAKAAPPAPAPAPAQV
jgi:hypothetical protein